MFRVIDKNYNFNYIIVSSNIPDEILSICFYETVQIEQWFKYRIKPRTENNFQKLSVWNENVPLKSFNVAYRGNRGVLHSLFIVKIECAYDTHKKHFSFQKWRNCFSDHFNGFFITYIPDIYDEIKYICLTSFYIFQKLGNIHDYTIYFSY